MDHQINITKISKIIMNYQEHQISMNFSQIIVWHKRISIWARYEWVKGRAEDHLKVNDLIKVLIKQNN